MIQNISLICWHIIKGLVSSMICDSVHPSWKGCAAQHATLQTPGPLQMPICTWNFTIGLSNSPSWCRGTPVDMAARVPPSCTAQSPRCVHSTKSNNCRGNIPLLQFRYQCGMSSCAAQTFEAVTGLTAGTPCTWTRSWMIIATCVGCMSVIFSTCSHAQSRAVDHVVL